MNREQLKAVANKYRVPLVLCAAGVLFLILALFLFIRTQTISTPIEFTQNESTQSASTRTIQVDVQGAVKTPAVYTFTEGARVSDALNSAGGLSTKADLEWINKNMNRAAKLIDGGKIYIPLIGENTGNQTQSSNVKVQTNSENTLGVTTGLININTASASELDTLPGVGEVTVEKIISGRPYSSIEELKTKKAVGNALFEKIKDRLTI
jgi:competence protein ComEA